nr:MAG TPA: tail protein [Caudoviricetes sp.]
MIELYNSAHVHVASLEKVDGQHVRRTLSDGDENLEFSYPRKAAAEVEIKTEGYVRTERQEYVIKSVDRKTRATMTSVAAALNIEALEGTVFLNGFETVEKTIQECMELALADTGWRCSVAEGITKRRTIRAEDDTTAWEIVKDVVSTYKVEIRIETLEKCLYFSTKRGQDKGVYFYERLNLRSLGVKESSYGFFTKIIPIGKDGLHLWVGEKDYIENHQYSPKTITAIWRDERYTNTTSLYDDAVARLEEASRPVMAYTGDVVDLAKQSEKYAVLDYDLGDTVILASESIGVWIKQRIVQLDEYAGHPEKNKAEFSNVPQTFAQLQKSGDDLAKKEAIRVASKTIREQLTNTYYTKEEVQTAIRAMSDAIELEVSKSYVTKGEGEEYAAAAKKAAEEAGKAAENAANEHTDSVLLAYSTTEEMDAAIKVATDAIDLAISQKYATTEMVEKKVGEVQGKADQAAADAAAAQGAADQAKVDADAAAKKAADAQSAADAAAAEAAAKEAAAKDAAKKAEDAAAAAKKYTDDCLVDYSTTTEMDAAIKVAKDAIDLSVSEKYATIEKVNESVKMIQKAADDAAQKAKDAQAASDAANTAASDAAQKAKDAQAAADKAAKDAAAAEENAAEDAAAKAEAAKQAAIEAAAAQSAADAKNYTDGRLVEYSTTTEMKATILAMRDEIELSVSKTVTEGLATKEEMDAALKLLSDEMTLKFTQTNQTIEGVDSDLQEKFRTITKYFTFDINGLTIGEVDNPNKVIIDSDMISIMVNGVPVQQFDAMGRALTPELMITKSLTLLGYQIVKDGNGNVNCGYVEEG